LKQITEEFKIKIMDSMYIIRASNIEPPKMHGYLTSTEELKAIGNRFIEIARSIEADDDFENGEYALTRGRVKKWTK